jgi:tetratricopeptide (TPR) repeat protein
MGFWQWIFGKGGQQRAPKRLTRKQMDLLWMDRTGLALLKASLGNPSVAVLGVNPQGSLEEHNEVTKQDVEWAEQVMSIAELASAASQRSDFAKAIQLYKKALKLAPECDLYLMSIGCCYGNLGKPREGLPYLERAAAINPNNARIRNNLAGIKQMVD